MTDILLTIRASNNRLVRARREMGYRSAASFARAAGLEYQEYVGMEAFRVSPIDRSTGDWKRFALRVADAMGISPEKLWPVAMQRLRAKRVEIALPADLCLGEATVRAALGPGTDEAPWPWGSDELKAKLERMTNRRDAYVLTRYYGLDSGVPSTLEAVGIELGVTRERVRTLLHRGLEHLRSTERD